MADANFSDVVKKLEKTNSLIEEQTRGDNSPNPKKFIKEELFFG